MMDAENLLLREQLQKFQNEYDQVRQVLIRASEVSSYKWTVSLYLMGVMVFCLGDFKEGRENSFFDEKAATAAAC